MITYIQNDNEIIIIQQKRRVSSVHMMRSSCGHQSNFYFSETRITT